MLDPHDRPVDGARIVVSALRGSLERTTRTASDGTFAFTGVALGSGGNGFRVVAQTAAGNTASFDTTINGTVADTLPPTITAALLHDTGRDPHDGITSDPTIAGVLGKVVIWSSARVS